MKRKLDVNDVPSLATSNPKVASDESAIVPAKQPAPQVDAAAPSSKEDDGHTASFTDFGLDLRLMQAVSKLKYERPTLVQQKAIPLALDGKDVLAKARTGSGKTAAYLLPVIHSILKRTHSKRARATSALILVPTRELADQVSKNVEQLITFCARDVQSVNLAGNEPDVVRRSLLSQSPDIVIATPARAWESIKSNEGGSGRLKLDKLTHLVLDEADLVLSYGYKKDLENVSRILPKGVQTIMMSATLTDEVELLKGILCRNPVLLDLQEKDAAGEGVEQYVIRCGEDEKFLLAYVIFKLQLLKGKAIIFVSDTDRCYRLKLFFEQFGIRSCILNSELPLNSRIHVVEEFNKNVYDYIIASDEGEILGGEQEASERIGGDADDSGEKKLQPKKKRKSNKDREYGISRGIDFKNVAVVINFDLPTTAKSYAHRIGRTARAGKAGMALSFVIPKALYRKHVPTSVASAEHDEKILARIEKQQLKVGKEVKPYTFDMAQVEAFRYRMNDALRAVSKVAIREARTHELRQELLKSDKLKRHFEENPSELKHLRHDMELRTVRQQPHLRHVPNYMLPAEGKKGIAAQDLGHVPLRKYDPKKKGRMIQKRGTKGRVGKSSKRVNPLKTLKIKRKTT